MSESAIYTPEFSEKELDLGNQLHSMLSDLVMNGTEMFRLSPAMQNVSPYLVGTVFEDWAVHTQMVRADGRFLLDVMQLTPEYPTAWHVRHASFRLRWVYREGMPQNSPMMQNNTSRHCRVNGFVSYDNMFRDYFPVGEDELLSVMVHVKHAVAQRPSTPLIGFSDICENE